MSLHIVLTYTYEYTLIFEHGKNHTYFIRIGNLLTVKFQVETWAQLSCDFGPMKNLPR